MEKFDYSDIAHTNVKYDGARPWDCQYLQAILVVGYVFPICIGGNFSECLFEVLERGLHLRCKTNKVLCSASKAIWLSMVHPAVTGPCSSDTEGYHQPFYR